MNHIGLFEGIGGFSYAARLMGWKTIAWCEINPFCQRILNYHFPDAVAHGDIKQTDFTIYANKVDILTGGFPCQPFSQAGQRKGTDDERHLWPEMLRAIREIRPTWVVGENVLGIVNWSAGLVFEQVQLDLEAEGYTVQPYVLPACGVDAPHQRYRVWFVAYSKINEQRKQTIGGEESEFRDGVGITSNPDHIGRGGEPQQPNGAAGKCHGKETRNKLNGCVVKNPHCVRWSSEKWEKKSNKLRQWKPGTGNYEWLRTNNEKVDVANAKGSGSKRLPCRTPPPYAINGINGNASHTHGKRCCKQPGNTEPVKQGQFSREFETGWFESFPTQSPVCSRDDGLSYGLDGITFPRWRSESIKGFGNAIVPQVALQIFKSINEFEKIKC